MEEDDAREVVYMTEYGATIPAWVELDTGRWMARHWLFPVVMMGLAGVFTFLMLTVISGFLWLVLVCVFLLWRYWNVVRHRFRHGNANPGRVVSVEPPLVAVWTDLDNVGKEEVVAPVVKVLRYPLKTVLGQPLAWGQAVPTASSYSGSEKAEAWTDFEPLFLEEGCGDVEILNGVLERIPAWLWAELDGAVQRLTAEGNLKPGLWRVG